MSKVAPDPVGEISEEPPEMVGEMSKRELTPLLPDRHPQLDFFLCDILDATPKSDLASMAFPLFTLATKPDHVERRYEQGDYWIEIRPGSRGRATVHDRDVLIYCISQCMAALQQRRAITRTLRLHARHLLQVTNRQTNGNGYKGLEAALERLQATQVVTNVTTGGIEQMDMFSFIDRARIVKETSEGRMLELEITLSDWVFNAIREKGFEILTLHRDYFRLRKPLERRLYELARKHCGKNPQWRFTTKTLHARTGSASSFKEFMRMLRKILADASVHHHIPDYDFVLEGDLLTMTPRPSFLASCNDKASDTPTPLRPATYERARKLAPHLDLETLEAEWRAHIAGLPTLPSLDAAFIGYVKDKQR